MIVDPIVEEVRKIRDELAARFNYDAHAIAEHAREHEKTCGHKVVDLSKKRKGDMETASISTS